jgi:hypothetical protein
MIIGSTTLDPASAYKLLIGSITPRAIGWISTLSKDGVANLAPISFFTGAGRKPPMVCINLQPRSDGVTLKDTFINIRDTGEFVANMVTLEQAHSRRASGRYFGPEGRGHGLENQAELVCADQRRPRRRSRAPAVSRAADASDDLRNQWRSHRGAFQARSRFEGHSRRREGMQPCGGGVTP